MATVVRATDKWVQPLADAVNSLRAQIGAGSSFHLDKCERSIAAANATDLASSLTLCRELVSFYNFHIADTLAHKVADTVNTVAASVASVVDLASAITAANQIKTAYTAHIASTTYNYAADATNGILAANATDLASLQTLLNEMKTDIAAHTQSGPTGASIRVVGA